MTQWDACQMSVGQPLIAPDPSMTQWKAWQMCDLPSNQSLNNHRSPYPDDTHTARTLFCLSYAALWCALTSHGWQRTEFRGERELDGQTYHQAYIGSYGLYDVQFDQTGGPLTVPYTTWGLAQTDPYALPVVLAAAACVGLAAASGALVFLTHLRGVCTRQADTQARFTKLSAYFAIPQCVLTAAGVAAWRCIRPGSFSVFCTRDGCVQEDPAKVQGATMVGYAWVFALASAVIALFLALTLWRLAHYDDGGNNADSALPLAGEEVEVPLANGVIHMPHPQLPHRTLTTTRSPAVMGGVGPSPCTAAEAWNPQQHEYLPVGGPGSARGSASGNRAPSWLAGV